MRKGQLLVNARVLVDVFTRKTARVIKRQKGPKKEGSAKRTARNARAKRAIKKRGAQNARRERHGPKGPEEGSAKRTARDAR